MTAMLLYTRAKSLLTVAALFVVAIGCGPEGSQSLDDESLAIAGSEVGDLDLDRDEHVALIELERARSFEEPTLAAPSNVFDHELARDDATTTSSDLTGTPSHEFADDGVGTTGDGIIECYKFENGDIGTVNVSATIGGLTVTIRQWKQKIGAPGEYVGFTYTVSGGDVDDVTVSVKSGTDVDEAVGDGSWVNPNGTSGPNAHGISNITFCENPGSEEPPPPPPPSDPAPTPGTCASDDDCAIGSYCNSSGRCVEL
jgi:hypothetical protein